MRISRLVLRLCVGWIPATSDTVTFAELATSNLFQTALPDIFSSTAAWHSCMTQENHLEVWCAYYKRPQLSYFILHISIFFWNQWYLIGKRCPFPQVSLEICTLNMQLHAFTSRRKLFWVKLEFFVMINVVPQAIKVSGFAAWGKASD